MSFFCDNGNKYIWELSCMCHITYNALICHLYLCLCREQRGFKPTPPFSPPMVICVDGSKWGLTTYKTMLRDFLSNTGNPQRHRKDNRANMYDCEGAVPLSFTLPFFIPLWFCFFVSSHEATFSPFPLHFPSFVSLFLSASICSSQDTDWGLAGGSKHSSSPAKSLMSI